MLCYGADVVIYELITVFGRMCGDVSMTNERVSKGQNKTCYE